MTKPFRWEAEALADDPFAGDFGNGEVALSTRWSRRAGAGPATPALGTVSRGRATGC